MKRTNPYDQYLNIAFDTASPERLVIMSYDATIRSLKEASRAIRENDYESRTRSFDLALGLINELRKSLNKEKGGEVADKLDNLYQYFTRELLLANVSSDADRLEPIVTMLTDIRQSWFKVYKELANS